MSKLKPPSCSPRRWPAYLICLNLFVYSTTFHFEAEAIAWEWWLKNCEAKFAGIENYNCKNPFPHNVCKQERNGHYPFPEASNQYELYGTLFLFKSKTCKGRINYLSYINGLKTVRWCLIQLVTTLQVEEEEIKKNLLSSCKKLRFILYILKYW